jgi:hypothetical protein
MKFSIVPSATRRFGVRSRAQPKSLAAPLPPIFRRNVSRIPLDAMRHRASIMFFSVQPPRQPSDSGTRHQFAHKHPAPALFAARAPPDIKTQIHFVEISVEGNCQESVKLGAQKLKSNDAYKRPASKRIRLNSARNILPQNLRLNFVVQHHQVAPLRRQEDAAFHPQYPTVNRWP